MHKDLNQASVRVDAADLDGFTLQSGAGCPVTGESRLTSRDVIANAESKGIRYRTQARQQVRVDLKRVG